MLRAVVTTFALLCLTSLSWSSQSIQSKAQPDVRPRLGLVLSGGGARGFAHIGVLKALEEMRIPFDVIAGTSMGSMVGGGFAAGYSADEIRDITLSVNWPRMFAPSADREKLSWHRKEEDREGVGRREIGVSAQGVKFPAQFVPSQELDIFLQRVTEPVNSVNDLSQLSIPFAALATDLESGARVVLQKGVTLSQAMRASMSVPGAYAPVEYGGRLLVDGGLVDNLPVGQARSMGAEVVVAINVGTPLSKRKSLDSVVGIMGQVVNLLTEQNVQASLKELQQTDIYIAPDLSGFNSGDFMRSAEIIERGYQAAIARKKDLEVFSVSQEQYRAWQQARAKEMRRVHSHKLSGVRIDGLKVVNAKRVLSDIDINAQGEVQNEEVAEAAREIWATGDFQRVPFRFEPGPYNTEVLVFEPQEKDYGYSVLRFGGNLQSNFQEANTFNVILSHSWSWLNSWGASWNNLLQLGEVKRIVSQWHQPLGAASKFFLMPQVNYKWEPFELYDQSGNSLARFRNESFDAGLYLGYDMGRFGRIKAGGGWLDTILRVGGQLAEFACLGGLSGGWVIALRKAKLHPVLHLLFAGSLTAAIDETLQLLFGQGAGLLDMWLDFAGFAGGLLVTLVVRAFLCRSAPDSVFCLLSPPAGKPAWTSPGGWCGADDGTSPPEARPGSPGTGPAPPGSRGRTADR